MVYLDFISQIHSTTSRDYLGRVLEYPKAAAASIAKRFDRDYWDGDRRTGYGGYRYDGRWRPVAESLARHYGLSSESRVLDIGCGKGFLIYDITQIVPGITVVGVDISEYALKNGKTGANSSLILANATALPFSDLSFDLAISITTLHNLYCYQLDQALREMERVARCKYLCVESYRNEAEKANLLYWQLTCEMFCTPDEWLWWFNHTGFSGDYSFIFFE